MGANTIAKKYHFFNGLQILRGLASLAVLLAHLQHYLPAQNLFSFLPGGGELTMAVYLFFALSGFLMAYLIDIEQKFFLLRRIVRIYPTFFLAILFYEMVYISLDIGGFNFLSMWESCTLLPLSTAQRPLWYPLGVEWTLIYEVFFYFICSLFAFKYTRKYFLIFLLMWFFIIIYTNNYISVVSDNLRLDAQATSLLAPNYRWIFFSPKNLVFIGGALSYFLYKNKFRLCQFCYFYISCLIVVLFVASMRIGPHSLFGTVLQVFTFSLLILLVLNLEDKFKGALEYKGTKFLKDIFVRLGDYSYGIYLSHVFVIVALTKIFSSYVSNIYLLSIVVFCVTLFFSLVFGKLDVAVHKFFKKRLDTLSLSNIFN